MVILGRLSWATAVGADCPPSVQGQPPLPGGGDGSWSITSETCVVIAFIPLLGANVRRLQQEGFPKLAVIFRPGVAAKGELAAQLLVAGARIGLKGEL